VVIGEQPLIQQVKLHILPLQLEYDGFRSFLMRKLLSMIEALT